MTPDRSYPMGIVWTRRHPLSEEYFLSADNKIIATLTFRPLSMKYRNATIHFANNESLLLESRNSLGTSLFILKDDDIYGTFRATGLHNFVLHLKESSTSFYLQKQNRLANWSWLDAQNTELLMLHQHPLFEKGDITALQTLSPFHILLGALNVYVIAVEHKESEMHIS